YRAYAEPARAARRSAGHVRDLARAAEPVAVRWYLERDADASAVRARPHGSLRSGGATRLVPGPGRQGVVLAVSRPSHRAVDRAGDDARGRYHLGLDRVCHRRSVRIRSHVPVLPLRRAALPRDGAAFARTCHPGSFGT